MMEMLMMPTGLITMLEAARLLGWMESSMILVHAPMLTRVTPCTCCGDI